MMMVSMALEALGLALTAVPSLLVAVLAIGILTCGFFGAHAIASGWVSRRAATDRAAAASLYLFAYYVGSSLFGSVGGLFWSRFGWPGVMGLVGVLIVAGFALARALAKQEGRAG